MFALLLGQVLAKAGFFSSMFHHYVHDGMTLLSLICTLICADVLKQAYFGLTLKYENTIFFITWRLASLLWDIGKQNSPRCDAASHLGLFCLHREISSKNEIKK